MMRTVLLVVLTILAGCTTISSAVVSKGYDLSTLRSAYVVTSGKNVYSGTSIAAYIQPALADHGVTATSGPLENKPREVDFYVTYVDRWRWDGILYLSFLEVSFFDGKTDKLIVSGRYDNSNWLFHKYPTPSEKAKEVISSIYLK